MRTATVRTTRDMRLRRHRRVRGKIAGTAERPRLAVFRSNRGIFAQLVDDSSGRTLAGATWTALPIVSSGFGEFPDLVDSGSEPGVVYTLDRQTGEFLWARPTVAQNVISNIDPTSGKVVVNPEVVFTKLNDEPCTCGCNQTLARCRVDDPTCPVSLPRAKEVVAAIVK